MVMFPKLFLITCGLFLAGCAPMAETRISSAGQSNVEKLGFILAPADKTASSELTQGRSLVISKLQQLGFEQNDIGPYYLEIGVSARPASIAILEADKTVARANTKRPSRKCPAQEYRVSLSLTRIADGAVMYRASSGEYHCKAALAATLSPLIDHAMADLGKPRGEYVVKTKGR
jgi:hypothetical protein